jgi:hypothetical protein
MLAVSPDFSCGVTACLNCPRSKSPAAASRPALTGNRITGVIARTPALRYPLPTNLASILGGTRLASVSRRGKYLLLDFGNGHLLIHLGMSGSLRLVTPPVSRPKSTITSTWCSRSRTISLPCACAIRAASARSSGYPATRWRIRCWRYSASNR